MKYTDGPWEAITLDDPRGQPVPYHPGLVAVIEHGERYLAVVRKEDNETPIPREEWEGNARLIAAAPELLRAARAWADWRVAYGGVHVHNTEDALLDLVMALEKELGGGA